MPMAVNITMVMVRITPTRPGTMYTAVRRSGLYQVDVARVIGAAGTATPRCARTCSDHDVTTVVAARVALATVCGSAPSTTSWTATGWRSVRPAAKPAGTTTPTRAS